MDKSLLWSRVMFVSSYNTYVNTNNTQKIQDQKSGSEKSSKTFFDSKLIQNIILESTNTKNFPINYISNYKAFSNKQKLEDALDNTTKDKYSKNKAIKNAQSAYANNSKIFSFLLKPKMAQSQTPKIDINLPNDIQILQEQNMRHRMVNTYLKNEKYHQITA
ncbi:hypothetical protein [Sulfurimonas sp.]